MRWLPSTRVLPSVLAGSLLTLAAQAPAPSRDVSVPPAGVNCDGGVQASPGDSIYLFPGTWGVLQPILPGMTVSACSLRFSPLDPNFGWMRIREWDPLTLTPDSRTIALRTSYLTPSDLTFPGTHVASFRGRVFDPPLVTQAIPQVAEPPLPTVAIAFQGRFDQSQWEIGFEPEGVASLPQAFAADRAGSAVPLRGGHPVLDHWVCSGGAEYERLRVVQSVMRRELQFRSHPVEFVQNFRVPQPVEPRWVELAVERTGYEPASVAIEDVEGSRTRVTAPFVTDMIVDDAPRWIASGRFARGAWLRPGREYRLIVRSAQAFLFNGRFRDAGDPPDFQNGIGTLHTRASAIGPWTLVPGQALLFRLVGEPLVTIDVPRAPGPGSLGLRLAPNPSMLETVVQWWGGTGTVRVEVLDARGRRVADHAGGNRGEWTIASAAGRGSPLMPGVYFVRVRDQGGGQVVERVTFLR
jgi:hypothetical protein